MLLFKGIQKDFRRFATMFPTNIKLSPIHYVKTEATKKAMTKVDGQLSAQRVLALVIS